MLQGGCFFKILGAAKILSGSSGLYEVIDYELSLELYDIRGSIASVNKRQTVRYLQDHIIAYQDQAWGQGEILVDYSCAPGIPADIYQEDKKQLS